MKLAYVAGPYRAPTAHERQENIHQARRWAGELWKRGYAVICPHMNTANLDGTASEAEFLAGTLEMMKRCDVVFLMPRWKESEGARHEKSVATALGMDVRELFDPLF